MADEISVSALRITLVPEDFRVRVVAVGEIDIATAALLEVQLQELWDAGANNVAIDLRQLSFMDSSGVRVLLDAHRMAQRERTQLRIVQGPGPVARALSRTGMDSVLPVVETWPPERTR